MKPRSGDWAISLKPGTNMVDIMRGLRCCVVDGNGVIIQSDALLTPQEVMSSDSTNTTAFSQLSSGCNNDDSSFVVLKQPTMAQSETTSTQDNQFPVDFLTEPEGIAHLSTKPPTDPTSDTFTPSITETRSLLNVITGIRHRSPSPDIVILD
uniref:(California timema) hypothetical protein n=1 Tax=Timema californicum TaxID=61474 RepID=A0A7R9P7G6_TIMCA|nr:unnamed protein product [Timema californicum]